MHHQGQIKPVRCLAVVAIGVLLASFVTPGSANAALQLRLSLDGTTWETRTLSPTSTPGEYTYSTPGSWELGSGGGRWSVDIEVTTTSPGTPSEAQLTTVNTTVRRNGEGDAGTSLYIEVVDDTFTQPIGSDLLLESTFTIVNQTGSGPGTPSLTSKVLDGSFELASISHGAGLPTTIPVDNSTLSTFSLLNETFVSLDHNNPHYSIETQSVTKLYVASEPGNGELVPEPSTAVVWSLLGLSAWGFGWRRRRKSA